MTGHGFDAIITLNDGHLLTANMSDRPAEAVAVVRRAIEAIPGAGWIDVEAQTYPPSLPAWVIVYPLGRAATPDTPDWHETRRLVEAVAMSALVAAGASL